MLEPLLSLLAAKAKAVGLVAATALVTSALVGGGAVVITTVSAESPLPAVSEQAGTVEGAPLDVTPGPAASPEPSPTEAGEQSPPAEKPATPAEKPARPAEEPATTLAEKQEAAAPPHVCLPGEWRNHGHYVSSYGRSLPKGPDRGPLVSAAARSDCGKKAKGAAAGRAGGKAEGAAPGKPAKAGVGNGKGQGAKNGRGHGADKVKIAGRGGGRGHGAAAEGAGKGD